LQVLPVSLAERVEVARIVKPNEAKLATLDIERFPGAFRIDNWRGLKLEGEFWDLGQYRRSIGRRIHPDEVTRWPRTICLAWRFYGAKRVEFASEWDDGYEDMLHKAWDVFDRADIVQGHNMAGFDRKKLTGEWAVLGKRPPSPYKVVDTLKVARTELGMESNTLDSLCKRFGLVAKTDKYDIEVARAALDGDVKAQKRIRGYNVGDIGASEGLADYLRPWNKSHPHMGTPTDERTCNRCGSTDLTLLSKRYRATVQDYALLQCNNCGGHVRAGYVARVAHTRGVA
jgi:hypothetical protein